MSDETENNIFQMISGGKQDQGEPAANPNFVPRNDYVIVDIDGNEYFGSGFLLFTSQHIAIMRDYGNGALPVLVVPLARVASAELMDDEVLEEELPF